ncbi:MAG TPA: hypothetical protein VE820_05505 [Sphingomicrobium sp.]|nr:hypothetical protein [Sphingomicrobium sp.]
MAHGYLGDGYGSHGDIGDDRGDGHHRDWRERSGRGDSHDWRHRDRDNGGMMFGGGRDRNRSDEDDRWRGSNREGLGREHGFGNFRGDQGGFGRSGEQGRSFSADPDDHYRSWRDRHMTEIDRDYQDYCREREQQFHREFEDWRRQKYGNPQPLRTGMTQTGMSHDPSGEFELTNEASVDPSGSDPTADATLGTNSSGTRGGRSRRA